MMKAIFRLTLAVFSLFFISCTTEVTLTLKQDNSVDILFEGGAGDAFSKMISSAAGMSASAASPAQTENDFLIDADSVSYELAKAGFSDVKVNQKKSGALSISMCDKKQTSYIFTSGIVKNEKGSLKTAVSKKSLVDFYEAADEQTRMILDLFLAPVFNGENMQEAEYIQMVGAFYGENAAKEVNQSVIKINLISKDGKKETIIYPLSQIMCGNL